MINQEKILYPIITLMWVFGLAMAGGTAAYLRKIRLVKGKRFSIAELSGEIFISGFIGYLILLLADVAGWDVRLIGAAAGVGGHMGSRAIFYLENYFLEKADLKLEGDSNVNE